MDQIKISFLDDSCEDRNIAQSSTPPPPPPPPPSSSSSSSLPKITFFNNDDNGYDEDTTDENTITDEDKSHTIIPSDEQQKVVETICQLKNTVVIAKAGCGKTTTAIETAKAFYEKFKEKTLILTFNTLLKSATRKEILSLNIQHHVEAHSYHAAAQKFFSGRNIINHNGNELIYSAIKRKPVTPLNFGLVIIDESQDMTELYCQFVQHVLKHCTSSPILLMLGDPFQQIFAFQKSSLDYMRHPEKYFSHLIRNGTKSEQNTGYFTTLHLNISYRISHEMAEFINLKLSPINLKYAVDEKVWKEWEDTIIEWWGSGIHANPQRGRDQNSVIYQRIFDLYKDDEGKNMDWLYNQIQSYPTGKVTLISQSMKDRSPMKKVLERLSRRNNENWNVLHGENILESNVAEKISVGKNTASTIHRYKGMQNDLVVIIGLDSFMEETCKTDIFDEQFGQYNLFYVAATRAKQQLVIWQTGFKPYVTIRKTTHKSKKNIGQKMCTVTKLINYVCFDPILSLSGGAITYEMINPLDSTGLLDHSVSLSGDVRLIDGRTPGTKEDISGVIGVFVELLIQQKCHQPPKIYSYSEVMGQFEHTNSVQEIMTFLNLFYEKSYPTLTDEDLIQFALAKFSIDHGLIHYWRQMNSENLFKWVKQHHHLLQTCINNAKIMLAQLLNYELMTTSSTSSTSTSSTSSNDSNDSNDWKNLSSHITFWPKTSIVFDYPWFTEKFSKTIVGDIDLWLDNGILVELKITSEMNLDYALQAQLYSSMKELSLGIKSKPVVIIPNLGQMYSVNLCEMHPPVTIPVSDNFNLIYRCAKRRMLSDLNDTSTLEQDYKMFMDSHHHHHNHHKKFISVHPKTTSTTDIINKDITIAMTITNTNTESKNINKNTCKRSRQSDNDNSKSYKEMQMECKKYKLPATGKKKDLQQRLDIYFSKIIK